MKDKTRLWLDSLSPSVDDVFILDLREDVKCDTLPEAISKSNFPWVIALLRSAEQIEQFLQKAVRIAICHKKFNVVRFLMRYLRMECLQTILSEVDHQFETPLHRAIWHKSLPIVRCIFETYPPALYERRKYNLSPFQFALRDNSYAKITHYFLDNMPDSIKQLTLKKSFYYVSSYDIAPIGSDTHRPVEV